MIEVSYDIRGAIKNLYPNFGYNGYGEAVFYRTYSRNVGGRNENWHDCVERVVRGAYTLKTNHLLLHGIDFDPRSEEREAQEMAVSMFNMEWLPPGRGLWAMGTEHVYTRGSMALYNCAFTELNNHSLGKDFEWMMDCLMCGVGVGFDPCPTNMELQVFPVQNLVLRYNILDTRESWAKTVHVLVDNCIRGIETVFDYSSIRLYGSPIKTFGGISSGPNPLIKLHKQIRDLFTRYRLGSISSLQLKTDISNCIGCCVVSGNVRRSAEIAITRYCNGKELISLKNYDMFPERAEYGGMSNNTLGMSDDSEFAELGDIAQSIIQQGEPGVANLVNFKYGRLGFKNDKRILIDEATGLNPCGEIPLENKEVCNLAATFPTRCKSLKDWYSACAHATRYCTIITTHATHRPETNNVVARNRRIGVDLSDYRNWAHSLGHTAIHNVLKIGYDVVKRVNIETCDFLKIPHSIRVTTIKPGGSVPKLAGVVSGIGVPTFNYTRRRMNVAKVHPLANLLITAGYPYEELDERTWSFSFPIHQKGETKVSLFEQAKDLETVQAIWSDNAVSNTLYFRPKWKLVKIVDNESDFGWEFQMSGLSDLGENEKWKLEIKWDKLHVYEFDPEHEEGKVESVLAQLMPNIKSCSMLPHTAEGVYDFMPESALSKEQYDQMLAHIKPIDWRKYAGDGIDEKYCVGDVCELPKL